MEKKGLNLKTEANLPWKIRYIHKTSTNIPTSHTAINKITAILILPLKVNKPAKISRRGHTISHMGLPKI
jgi:hypothetical protein